MLVLRTPITRSSRTLHMLLRGSQRNFSGTAPMAAKIPFSHGEVYNPVGCACHPKVATPTTPKVFIAPPHYIQGPSIIKELGRYASKLMGAAKVGLLITSGGQKRQGSVITESLEANGIKSEAVIFSGVNSYEEVETHVQKLQSAEVDVIIAVGGGSCHDCGKLIAHKLGVPTVIVSTLAATDAPCSALSIMYTPSGGYHGGEVYPQSPNCVIVDTDVVAKAGKRSLVSGFGDALSTYYEARTVFENPLALSMCEARPTRTALALGQLCSELLYENALDAVTAVEREETDEAFENVVEANTLLSGLGFESGGLAASHAVAQALSFVPSVHDHHMHGEMVAMGLLTMLVLEKKHGLPGTRQQRAHELAKVGRFLCAVGLPVSHAQVHFDAGDSASIETFLDVTLSQWFCHNEPFDVNADMIKEAFMEVDQVGRGLIEQYGDEAYRSIHG